MLSKILVAQKYGVGYMENLRIVSSNNWSPYTSFVLTYIMNSYFSWFLPDKV